MYQDFFGLNSSPFQLSPDPFFLYSSDRNTDALASISESIRQRKGFAVMTGEVGTGKTLVLRCLVESLEREEIPFAYFIGPRLSTVDFLSYITFELGITVSEPSKGNLLRALYGFMLAEFEKGLTTVLIIDEAHQMPRSVLEEIRLLTNFETAQQKLVQIVLVGQPELEKKLDSVELRSLKQRIAVRCRLEPLRAEEIRQYIERRLQVAGADTETAAAIFPPDTIKAIYRYSLGIPRLVNSICDQALIAACARQVRIVPVEMIKEIASLFRLDPAPGVKSVEKPFSLSAHTESSAPDKSRQVAPAVSAVSAKPAEPELAPKAPSPDTAMLAQHTTAHSSDASHKPSVREDSTSFQHNEPEPAVPGVTLPAAPVHHEPARLAEATSILKRAIAPSTQITTRQAVSFTGLRPLGQLDSTQRDDKPVRSRRWLEPGLRLTLIIALIAIVPVALAAGVFMARRQKAAAVPSHEVVASVREVIPETQTIASLQPAAATSVVPGGAGGLGPASTLSPAVKPPVESDHPAPRAKVMSGPLSKPVLQSRPLSASAEPPSIAGTQTRGLDLGNLNPSVAPPMEQNGFSGASLGPNSAALPSAGLKSNSPVPVGGRINEPRLLNRVLPEYPGLARQTHAEGDVAVQVVIDKSGNVTDAKVISGPAVLRQSAIEAVRRWKYEPSLLDGQPISVQMLVTIRFRI